MFVHVGIHTCIFLSRLQLISQIHVIIIFISSIYTAPPFVQAYATSIAIEGRRGAVEFLVHSHPSPTSFTYYYNSEELDLSSDGKITVSEDTPSSLIIANVSRELAGNYTLVVTNSLGEGEGAIDLTVYCECQDSYCTYVRTTVC